MYKRGFENIGNDSKKCKLISTTSDKVIEIFSAKELQGEELTNAFLSFGIASDSSRTIITGFLNTEVINNNHSVVINGKSRIVIRNSNKDISPSVGRRITRSAKKIYTLLLS